MNAVVAVSPMLLESTPEPLTAVAFSIAVTAEIAALLTTELNVAAVVEFTATDMPALMVLSTILAVDDDGVALPNGVPNSASSVEYRRFSASRPSVLSDNVTPTDCPFESIMLFVELSRSEVFKEVTVTSPVVVTLLLVMVAVDELSSRLVAIVAFTANAALPLVNGLPPADFATLSFVALMVACSSALTLTVPAVTSLFRRCASTELRTSLRTTTPPTAAESELPIFNPSGNKLVISDGFQSSALL